jgi:ABC-type sugar transport system substrate-binding protein
MRGLIGSISGRARLAFLAGTVVMTGVIGGIAATAAAQPEAKPIQRIVHKVVQGPWLKWDKASCSFKTAATHPKTYVSLLRKAPAGMTLGFTPETTTLPFDLIMNKSISDAAKAAGIPLTVQSTEFPSKTVPVQVADAMLQVKPSVILSGLIIGDLYPAVQEKYFGACIPFVDQFAMPLPKPAPMFQTSFQFDGKMMGGAAVKVIKSRKWASADTWVVMCTDSQLSSKPGSIYDIGAYFVKTVSGSLHIPKDRQSFIECPGDKGPLASRIALRNWLTAHPQAKNVVGAAWDDGRAPGMVQALQDAGFTKNGVIVGRATTEDALKIIASGDPIFVADLNMGFPQWGPSMVALAEDIYEGKPVPTLTTPIESMVIGAASAKKTLKALYGK